MISARLIPSDLLIDGTFDPPSLALAPAVGVSVGAADVNGDVRRRGRAAATRPGRGEIEALTPRGWYYRE